MRSKVQLLITYIITGSKGRIRMKRIGLLSKCFAIALLLAMIGSELTGTSLAPNTIVARAEAALPQATGISVAYHTEEEIRNYLKSSGAMINDPVTYKEEPSTEAPYKAGSLTDETLNSSVKMVNQIRYIAGLSYNVELDKSYTEMAQAASLVNRVNRIMTHWPNRPSGMEESLYQLGRKGAESSNIASGYGPINSSLVEGYMEDGDSSNIERVGHRRWILNPPMSATGFGYCDNFSAMYVFDKNNQAASEYGVVWPAQTMPTDYFGRDYPWSISMGYEVDKDKVQVKLIRMSDEKTWNFSSTHSNGYFNVDNGGYGQKGCIIFRPDDVKYYVGGDVFQVTISGLDTPVSYSVSFFDLVPVTSVTIKKTDTKILKGQYLYLEASVTPADASHGWVQWSSSDKAIAEAESADVMSHGWVVGKSYGTAIITAKSSNGLEATHKITVVPKPIDVQKVTSAKKGQVTVSYQKDKTVSGYEVVYATDSKFSKNKKTKVVNKASISKTTISKLKPGQIYYFKVRSYALVDGKKVYGEYGDWDYEWVKN